MASTVFASSDRRGYEVSVHIAPCDVADAFPACNRSHRPIRIGNQADTI